MTPKLIKYGESFKGIANYLLHDKDKATTSERVAWTATRNLATDDPHVAWRVMAATAMDHEAIKQRAGVRSSGRKRDGTVMHFVISWKEGEAELSQDEMLERVDEALSRLGSHAKNRKVRQYADEHQALIVSHNDTEHPHVHVVVNRVHPEHGRMLTKSFSKRVVQELALEFEKSNGKILCPKRLENAEKRARGEHVPSQKETPRHIYELEQKYKDHPDRERIIKEQREKDRQLARRTREARQRREFQWKRLREAHRKARNAIREQTRKRMSEAAKKVHDDFTPKWKKLYRNQRRELYEFAQREKHFMGRIHNALSTVTLRSIMYGENRGAVLTQLFKAITSEGVRLGALEKVHLSATRRLQTAENQARDRVIQKERDKERKKLAHQGKQFQSSREQLVAQHEEQRGEIREAWRTRREDRIKAWNENAAVRSFNAATRNVDPRKGRSERRSIQRNPDPRNRPRGGPERGKGRDRER